MRVPVYDQPQVAPAALPEVRSRLDVRNGLGAVGQGVAQLGQGVQRAVDAADREQRAQQEKAIAAAATDAETRWATRALDIEHGPADRSRKGFYEMQGQEALAQSASTIEALAKAREEIASKLAPGVKDLFTARTNALLLQHRRSIESYTSAQADALNKATAAARVDAAAKTAALQYGNDALVATETEAARSALAAQLHGMPGEVVQQHLAALDQKVASARVSAAVGTKDLPAAERLLAAHGDQLGTDRPRLERTVATLKAQQLGEKNAQAAVAAATDPETGLVDEAYLDTLYDQTPDTAKTEEFKQAFAKQRAQALALDKGHRAGVFRDAFSQYLQGGGLAAVDAQHRTWLIQNDPEGWRRLQRVASEDAAAKVRASRGDSGPTAGQQVALGALLVDMGDHPDKYARMPVEQFVRTWFPLLSPGDRDKALQKLGDRHKEAAKPEKLGPLEERMLLHVGREAGVFPSGQNDTSKWDDAQFRAYFHASQALSERAAAVKAQTGKPPAPDQLEKWARDIFLAGKVPGSGLLFDDKTTRIEAVEEGKPFAPTWTDEQVDQATNALRAAGARVDDAAVDAYLRRKHELPAAPISAAEPKKQSEPSTTTSSIPVSMRTNGR